jgi:inhibitor of the pro-sigma K processing machinery
MENIILYAGIGVAMLIILRIFSLPVKWVFKLIINTLLGFLGLFAVNWLGSYIGINLGINIVNAVVVGTLGLPGLVLLLLLKWWYVI